MTIEQWSGIAQIVTAIITLVGVLVSLYMSARALNEVHLDRKLRQAPYLAFETGGFRVPAQFVKAGKRIPGLNPAYVEKVFKGLDKSAESIRPKHITQENGGVEFVTFGKLMNHGLGTAFQTKITWVPKQVRIGSEVFDIDQKKLAEPRYKPEINTTAPGRQNLKPGDETDLSWFPVFIEKDTEKKIKEVSGVIEIRCFDVFRSPHMWIQGFYVKTDYQATDPTVHITFGDPDQWDELEAA